MGNTVGGDYQADGMDAKVEGLVGNEALMAKCGRANDQER